MMGVFASATAEESWLVDTQPLSLRDIDEAQRDAMTPRERRKRDLGYAVDAVLSHRPTVVEFTSELREVFATVFHATVDAEACEEAARALLTATSRTAISEARQRILDLVPQTN